MSGERFISMIETGAAALVATLALVGGYVVLKRMARQMRKGVDLATRQCIEEVTLQWLEDGRLRVHVDLPRGLTDRLTIAFERKGGTLEKPSFETEGSPGSIDASLDVPSDANALVVEVPSEKLFRPLPPRT